MRGQGTGLEAFLKDKQVQGTGLEAFRKDKQVQGTGLEAYCSDRVDLDGNLDRDMVKRVVGSQVPYREEEPCSGRVDS